MTRVHQQFIVGPAPNDVESAPRMLASETQRWLRVRGFLAHHAEYGQFVSTSFVVIGCRC